MKKKILIIQFRTDKSLQHERECFLRVGDWDESEVEFINVLSPRNFLPETINSNTYSGLILGGSGQVNISDWTNERKNQVLRAAPLIKQAIEQDKPTLGICFGHQLISYLLGGSVTADPNQAETGTFEITLNEAGSEVPLFSNIPKLFFAVEGHKNSVVTLPNEAVLLASSIKCGIQAYRIKNNIYGIQFHPELDKDGMRVRLGLFPSYAKDKNMDEILGNYQPTPFAAKIIVNFKKLSNK